ncbi:MAG TPA: sugar phosphate isomerase/epimerase family protein [Tepidisphaeraceae bacterium]|jgi:hexulose-6-phosphate isomerase
MNLCISYWSVRDGLSNERPVEEAIGEAKAAGFDGIELACSTGGVLAVDTDQPTVNSYRKMAETHEIKLETLACGLSWGCSPTDPNPEIREKSIQLHAAALERAAWLGAKAMLMVPGAVKIPWDVHYGPAKYDDAVKWAREAAKRLGAVAEKAGVDLCLENVWNGMFYSPVELRDFIDSIGSARVGVYFDVGNVLGYHQHPPHWIEILGKRIKRVHVKDFKHSIGNITGFCDLLAGDVPWAATMAALRRIGYDKTLTAEMMPPDETLLKRTHDAMKKIVKM